MTPHHPPYDPPSWPTGPPAVPGPGPLPGPNPLPGPRPAPATPASPPFVIPDDPLPGDPGATDLAGRLLDQRRVLVTRFVDDDAATRAAAALMFLDANGDDPVELHLSAPDGELTAALGLADTVDLLGVPVVAYARGSVGGAALAVYGAATERRSSRLTVFRLQDPTVQLTGDAESLDRAVEHHRRLVHALHERVATASGQDVDRVAADFARGTVLGAEEAHGYGIVTDLLGR